jgi:hypothetical protein
MKPRATAVVRARSPANRLASAGSPTRERAVHGVACACGAAPALRRAHMEADMSNGELATISAGRLSTGRPARSVVAVSGEPQRAEFLNALLRDEHDYGVIVVESTARAYRRIKQVTPYMVIVFCEIDDDEACRLLSMLQMDAELADLLVLTCAIGRLNSALPVN